MSGGTSTTSISALQIASQLGPGPASALAMLRAFTGCNAVSFFLPAKDRAWKVWQAYSDAKNSFLSLLSGPDVLEETFCQDQLNDAG